MDAGTIVEVGRLRGDFASFDPSGRYIAVRHEDVLTVYDVHDELAAVTSWPVGDRAYEQVAMSPTGNAVVALNKDGWFLELWRTGVGTPVRAATDIEGSSAARENARFGHLRPCGVGWLQYSADGSYIYFGETVCDKPTRLNLLDPATLARLDSISQDGETAEDWGEDPQSCCAPSPSNAVAFIANAGDDIVVLGVAEVEEGRLRVHSGRSPDSWVDIPGERGMEIAFLSDDEIVVLDSDECLTRIRWRDRPMTVSDLASRSDLLNPDASTDPETAATLRSLVREDADERLMLTGPMFTSGMLLAIAVYREMWKPGRGSRWTTIGMTVVDISSGESRFLPLPEAEGIYLSSGTICQRIGSDLQISRWVLPAAEE